MVKGRNTRVIGIRVQDELYDRIASHLSEGESVGDWVKRAVEHQMADLARPDTPAAVEDVGGNEVVVQVKLHPAVYSRIRQKLDRKRPVISVARYCRELIEQDQGYRS